MVITNVLTNCRETNLENQLHISKKSPKNGFKNDIVFQHFLVELKHCNSDKHMKLKL